MTMRVLLVTDWNPVAGGVESYVRGIRPALERAGMRVRVLTSSAGSAMDGTADVVAWGTARRAPQAALQIVNPFAWRAMRGALAAFAPDVVHVHSFAYHLSPAVVLAVRRVPVVVTIHDYKPVCPLGTKLLPDGRACRDRPGLVCWRSGCLSLAHWTRDQARYPFITHAVRRARVLLTGSAWMQRALHAEGLTTEVAVYPVDPPPIERDRRPSTVPSFLYCGRLAAEKGVALLLRAVSRLGGDAQRASVVIAGDGPERPALERLAHELAVNDRVSFVGWQSADEVGALMSQAWAVVAPSLWAEPFGLVVLEAITRSVPVIAAATGGLVDLVRDGVTGLTFAVGDVDGLASRLSDIVAGRAFATHRLEDAVVKSVRAAHAPERHVALLGEVYRRVVGGAAGGGAAPVRSTHGAGRDA